MRFKPRSTPKASRKSKAYALIFLTLAVLLTSCNLPQSDARPFTSGRQQTEIAGILNPEGLATSTSPTLSIPEPPTQIRTPPAGYRAYSTQAGDTLPALALHFDVTVDQILSDQADLPPTGLLPPGLTLWLPDTLEDTLFSTQLLPDTAILYGPTVGDFDAIAFAEAKGGYLSTYTEEVREVTLTGPEILQTVAIETSLNPRLLLAFLEYRSGWVTSHPEGAERDPYPIGFGAGADTGLYKELLITAKLLSQGFYGWRDGSLLDLGFYGGGSGRLDPGLNAGTVALLRLFSTLYTQAGVEQALMEPGDFLALYSDWFGDPWERSSAFGPLLPADARQPELVLPFAPGGAWSLTGGPHNAWLTGSPQGAIDFAPITGEAHCAVSTRWATAAAAGLVVRSERGVVAIDLDGDGDEGTGWVLIYLHMAEQDRVSVGTWLAQDDPVGHPSCEGGTSTGTHLHLTRKFNGEWLPVDGPLPMLIGGWQVIAGEKRYEGYLVRGNEIIQADPNGMGNSAIIRED
jgi:murein DD-endopeptidase MepM/ murein hydrolase activator NlpD